MACMFRALAGLISIHALRKESDQLPATITRHSHISIHALRKESDTLNMQASLVIDISIHALRKESDDACTTCPMETSDFNPRSP